MSGERDMLSLHATMGIAISAVGVTGATIATFTTIRGARGPQERAFVVRSALEAWLAIAVLFALMYHTPPPYTYLLLIPYFIHLPIMTYRFTTKQQLIRDAEAGGSGTAEAD